MLVSSPHTWGCFHHQTRQPLPPCVFPTHVGVFLDIRIETDDGWRLPHTRGGVSMGCSVRAANEASSPHTWGCFRLFFISFILRYVFPTRVGVFLIGVPFVGPEIGLPHTRGGVSVISALFQRRPPSSPHAWGCFYRAESQPDGIIVFPTRVGVFLVHGEDSTVAPCLPHTRGGVSTSRRPRQGDHVSSPTRVGVFPCSWPSS